jgi:chloride channel protein, CIC family
MTDQFLRRLRASVRSASYLRKWVALGFAIGVVAGFGAIIFFWSLGTATHLLLGLVAGLTPPTPAGEGAKPITDAARPWLIPVVTGLGGLAAGLIVFGLAPEAEGHGTDAAIEAFHHDPRGIRGRIPLVKLVASAITIGSGGSGGREGPTAQISAGFGSFMARVLDLEPRDARIAVAAGIGSGIGAIFRAPLGGAVLGAEIMYVEDVEAEALVPSFIASIVAYAIFGGAVGFQPIFGLQGSYTFSDPAQLVWYAALGVLAGAVGVLYVRSFYGLTDFFRSWHIPPALKTALAGVLVGILGIALPGALGTGYGWLQGGLDRQVLMTLPLAVVILLPFAKILATSLSIGSGGSGGVFGPGMVIGGLLGATAWRLLQGAPGIPTDPAPFAIVAMMALFGSIAHAPLAVMLMVAEMTGNLGMLAPAMIAVAVATFVAGEHTIYRSQLRTRTESPAHRFRSALPLLAAITAGDAARPARCVIHGDEPAERARARLQEAEVGGAPVVARDGTVLGGITIADLEKKDKGTARDHARPWPHVRAADGLDEALGALSDQRVGWVPVLESGRLLGILSARDVMAAYRRALAGNIRQVRGLAAGGVLLEGELPPGSALVGHTLAEARLPREVVLVAIERKGTLIVPRGDIRFEPGDRVSFFGAPEAEAAARAILDLPPAGPKEATA